MEFHHIEYALGRLTRGPLLFNTSHGCGKQRGVMAAAESAAISPAVTETPSSSSHTETADKLFHPTCVTLTDSNFLSPGGGVHANLP
jgi:hypothetical protein